MYSMKNGITDALCPKQGIGDFETEVFRSLFYVDAVSAPARVTERREGRTVGIFLQFAWKKRIDFNRNAKDFNQNEMDFPLLESVQKNKNLIQLVSAKAASV